LLGGGGVTPVNGYCSVYDYVPEGALTPWGNPIVDFGGITVWDGECAVVIPEWGVNFGGWNLGGITLPGINFNIPGVSLCPKWANLGTLTLAEFEIPTDLLIIPAVMFVVGLIFKL
jgi:hypothetical protein